MFGLLLRDLGAEIGRKFSTEWAVSGREWAGIGQMVGGDLR